MNIYAHIITLLLLKLESPYLSLSTSRILSCHTLPRTPFAPDSFICITRQVAQYFHDRIDLIELSPDAETKQVSGQEDRDWGWGGGGMGMELLLVRNSFFNMKLLI